MNQSIINSIIARNDNKKDRVAQIISYLVSINMVSRIRGGGLFFNGQCIYSQSKILKLLKIII